MKIFRRKLYLILFNLHDYLYNLRYYKLSKFVLDQAFQQLYKYRGWTKEGKIDGN